MKQITKVGRSFIDNIKSYIIMGLIVVLVPSFALGQIFFQPQENGNKLTEKVVPNEPTEKVVPNEPTEKIVPVVPKVTLPRVAGAIPYGTIFELKKPVTCNDTPVIKNFIENMNGMIPITIGVDKNPMGVITSLIQLYTNPTTYTFAVVEHFAIKKSCIIFQGHDFDIILPERYSPDAPKPERQALN